MPFCLLTFLTAVASSKRNSVPLTQYAERFFLLSDIIRVHYFLVGRGNQKGSKRRKNSRSGSTPTPPPPQQQQQQQPQQTVEEVKSIQPVKSEIKTPSQDKDVSIASPAVQSETSALKGQEVVSTPHVELEIKVKKTFNLRVQ